MSRELAPRIVVDAGIRFGKPVIVGTRVPVETLVLRLSQGMSVTDVAEEYGVSTDDVLAALSYAAVLLSTEEIRETA